VLDRVVDIWAPSAGWLVAGLLLLVGTIGVIKALRSDRPATDKVRRRDVLAKYPR
jgi:hypothetical protein